LADGWNCLSKIHRAVGTEFQIGAFFALVIAMSGVSILGVSSPFWALVGGVALSLALESKQFERRETGDA
jgi:benzoate membrane transport protein